MLQKLKRVFVGFLKFLRGYFMMIGILVTVLPVVLAWVAARSGGIGSMANQYGASSGPKEDTRLDWDLDGELLEHSPDISTRFLEHFFGGQEGFYLPEIRRALKAAAADKNVKSLVLNIYDLQGSQAEFAELRRALVDFRKSNKPVHAHVTALDDTLLYLTSAADSVTLVPAGEVNLTGPAFQLVYFGEALKKLGVTVEVIRHGKYKSAFEPFTTNKPTAETIEMYRSMEASLSAHLIATIAEARKLPGDKVAGWFKRGIYTPAEALNAGIVDALGYSDDAIDRVEEVVESSDDMDFADYMMTAQASGADEKDEASKADDTKRKDSKHGLALIEAVGEIHMTASGGGSSQDMIAADELVKELRWAADEETAKAVVIRISSPGGSASASDIIWREVRALADQKPVVVSMGSYAASGGYYMAAPASWIVAEPTTITGSIGVIGMQLKFPQFESKYGVSFHTVNSSDRARLLNPGTPSSAEDKAILATAVDDVYQTFVAKVAEGRELKIDDVDRLAQGRVYTGIQAEELDLVDELGGLPDAFRTAKELAGLDPEKLYRVLRYVPDKPSLADCLSSPWDLMDCLQQGGVRSIAGTLIKRGIAGKAGPGMESIEGVERLRQFVEEDRVLAIWPGWMSRHFF